MVLKENLLQLNIIMHMLHQLILLKKKTVVYQLQLMVEEKDIVLTFTRLKIIN